MQQHGNRGRDRLRERLEGIRDRSQKSTPWRAAARQLGRLVNKDGYVPVRARLSQDDLDFLAEARDHAIAFAELGLRLVDLHQPREAGGISSDPDRPIRRCRACMWRWPCPTYRAVQDAAR